MPPEKPSLTEDCHFSMVNRYDCPAILKNAPVGYFIITADGGFLCANAFLARMIGYETPAQLIKNKNVCFSRAFEPSEWNRIVSSLSIDDVVDTKCRWVREDGLELQLDISLKRRGAESKIECFEGFAAETVEKRSECHITKKKHPGSELTTNNIQMQGIIQGSPIPTFVIDRNHKILYWNSAIEALTGFKATDMIGTNLQWRAFYPEARPCLADFLVDGATHEANSYYEGTCEKLRLIPDAYQGSGFFPACGTGRWLQFTAAAIRDRAGEIYGAIETIVDITEIKRAQEELQQQKQAAEEAEQQWETTFDAMPDLIALIDRNHRIVRINQSMARRLNCKPRETVGRFCFELVHGKSSPPSFCPHAKMLNSEAPELAEVYEQSMDGYFEVATTPIYDKQGNLSGSVHVAHDITHRKQTEDELKTSESKFRALVERLPDVVMRFDREGRHLFVSENVKTVSGIPASAFIGKTHREMGFSDELCLFWEESVQEVLDLKKPAEKEFRLPGKESEIIIDWRLIPESGPDGRIQTLLSISRDITKYRKMEQDYRVLFREMLNGFAHHEIICDASGSPVDYRYLAVNPAFERMTGLKGADILGKTVMEILPETEPYWIKTFGDVALTGKPVLFENYSQAFDRYFEVSAFSTAPGQFACVFVDVTKRKRAEAEQKKLQSQLVQAGKMEAIGRLAGGVAHDFNNMLGAILANAEVALDDLDPEDTVYDCVKDIQEAAKRSAFITRQLLAFARKQTVIPAVLNLNTGINKMLKIIKTLIGENIQLKWKPYKSLWPVLIDASQVDQIMANLCVNARDAIKGNGIIWIETNNIVINDDHCSRFPYFVPGDYVMLSIRDNGSGMDSTLLANLFEPFFTTKELGEGTGLGLATVYGIVKQNNGFIDVESEPGSGSCFRIYLPRHAGTPVPAGIKDETGPILQGSETILLVEDESIILNALNNHLKKLGYTVLSAEHPEEALRLAASSIAPINLLITDVIMPDMCGPELSDRVRQIHRDIKCLFMSGYTDDVISHHGVLEKGVQFIEKPFTKKSFAVKVREVLLESPVENRQ